MVDHKDGDAGSVALETLVLDEDLGAVAIAASSPGQNMANLENNLEILYDAVDFQRSSLIPALRLEEMPKDQPRGIARHKKLCKEPVLEDFLEAFST